MSPTYVALKTFTADGPDGQSRVFTAGETFGAEDILGGCLESGRFVGHIGIDDTPPVEADAPDEPEPDGAGTPEPAADEPEPAAADEPAPASKPPRAKKPRAKKPSA